MDILQADPLAEARNTIAELREREAHLRMAMEASSVVAYRWDIVNDRVRRLRALNESPDGFEDAGGFEAIVEKVLPEDPARFRADIAAAFKSPDGLYRTEVRYRDRDGVIHWVSESGRVRHDAAGRPVQMVGVTFDITERKQAEEALRQAEALVRELLETLPVGVLIAHDKDCTRITGNRIGNRIMRVHGNISKTPHEGDDVPPYRAYRDGAELPLEELPLRRVLAGKPVDALEYQLRFDDGTRVDLLVSAAALLDAAGTPHGAVATLLDITEQKRDRQALQDQDRRKNEFLATLAHELRNPLAPIRNAVEILRRQDGTSATSERMHAIIDRQMNHMVRLVDDLLDVSRISRGRLELRRERHELHALVSQAIESARPSIDRMEHGLAVAMPAERLLVDADGVRIVQAIVNLLTNAAKYTPHGGSIRLEVAPGDRGWAAVHVVDNGIGMSPEQISRAFDMFWQAKGNIESQGGLGIGLSLARSIVEMHGGSLNARSDGPGLGTEFAMRLPIKGE